MYSLSSIYLADFLSKAEVYYTTESFIALFYILYICIGQFLNLGGKCGNRGTDHWKIIVNFSQQEKPILMAS